MTTSTTSTALTVITKSLTTSTARPQIPTIPMRVLLTALVRVSTYHILRGANAFIERGHIPQ
jgi:hypothetical protein